ncbi:hypothetical protein [Isobaculum melis]|uniref:Uncharacterized protein n=1 Tax=Isobaculum melis TaxID=142588 RepID=A0A1H9TPH3_9LACT|nr:hypothetical protein [Isobaculum melis]SER98809.1 hypothetical protein SAMN04488559_11527 [Isobaculum melis]
MTYEELVKTLAYGEEYNFYYNNEEYWISKNKEGNYLTKVIDGTTQSFANSDELLEKAKIDGKTIKELWHVIKYNF